MRTRHPAVLVTAAVLALSATLTACGSDGDAAKPGQAAKEEGPGPVPTPNADQTRKLIDALKAIDPRLADPEKRAVQGAVVTCEALVNGVPRKTVVDTAASNFAGTGEAQGSLDKAKVDKIVTAVESSFCKV